MWKALNWRPPEELTPETLQEFFNFLGDSGITAVADGFIENDDEIRSIYELDHAGNLKCYYDGMVRFWSCDDLPGSAYLSFSRVILRKAQGKVIGRILWDLWKMASLLT